LVLTHWALAEKAEIIKSRRKIFVLIVRNISIKSTKIHGDNQAQ